MDTADQHGALPIADFLSLLLAAGPLHKGRTAVLVTESLARYEQAIMPPKAFGISATFAPDLAYISESTIHDARHKAR